MVNLSQLSDPQKIAVTETEGPLMILAGAGSGKTRTLVSRIIYLLNEKEVSPYRLLAVTFSNKAAREMRDRVASESDLTPGALQITTFHSFCAMVLRKEASYLGLSRNFTIYDDSESKAIIKNILAMKGITTKQLPPYHVLQYIESLKNSGYFEGSKSSDISPIDLEDEYFEYFKSYEQELRKSNAVDFGGLITGVLNLFQNFPEVLEFYQNKYHYVLVDEYQDTNRAQFELIKLISQKRKNICVVGDEDQSIYSWRGADIRNILDFEKVFPDSKLVKLEQNYRSSHNIIKAASLVIARNEMRKGKEMWTDNEEGDLIQIIECKNEKFEAQFISSKITHLRKDGTQAKDIAIFYRNNSQSRVLEDSLRSASIPYRVVGGIKFYDRKEIKDLISYLRLAVNQKDSLAFSRIVNSPPRGVGATTLRKLESEAVNMNCSLLEAAEQINARPEDFSHLRLSKKVKSALVELASLIGEVSALNQQKTAPSVCYEKLLAESGYVEYLKAGRDYESQARIENLQELLNAIKYYEEGKEAPNLEGFLETVALDKTEDSEESSADGEVVLMTIHSSKGLEFPVVFVTGVEENLFPSIKSLEQGSNGLEEERRLFYVAMTRAMGTLYLTFAQARMLFGSLKFNGPSRFLDEIPNKLYDWIRPRPMEGGSSSSSYVSDGVDYSDEYSQVSYEDDTYHYQIESGQSGQKYPVGTQLVHSLYGEGTVLECEGHENDEKVLIKFRDGTTKKFMASFAPLVKID